MGKIIISFYYIKPLLAVVFMLKKDVVAMNWDSYIKSYQSYLKIERGLSKNTIETIL
jgi:integrase/recombinase XerD